MFYQSKKSKFFAVSSVVALSFSIIAPSALAEENTDEQEQLSYEIEAVNESTLEMNIDNGEFDFNQDGSVTLTDEITGEEANLPTEAIDKNDEEVSLQYEVKSNDTLHIYTVNPDIFQPFALQCGLGTAGAAGLGGLGGFGVGAIPGAVVGGVAGGMSGAAASCF